MVNNILLERYRLAVTPGLTLLGSYRKAERQPQTLFAGMTEDNSRSKPLPYLRQELQAVQFEVAVTPLLNQAFTAEQLKRRLTHDHFGWVHLASHGRFSSQLQDKQGLLNECRIFAMQGFQQF